MHKIIYKIIFKIILYFFCLVWFISVKVVFCLIKNTWADATLITIYFYVSLARLSITFISKMTRGIILNILTNRYLINSISYSQEICISEVLYHSAWLCIVKGQWRTSKWKCLVKNKKFYFLKSLEMGDYASRKYKNATPLYRGQLLLEPSITPSATVKPLSVATVTISLGWLSYRASVEI